MNNFDILDIAYIASLLHSYSCVRTCARARVSVDPVSARASILARVACTLVGIGLTLVPLVARLTNTAVCRP